MNLFSYSLFQLWLAYRLHLYEDYEDRLMQICTNHLGCGVRGHTHKGRLFEAYAVNFNNNNSVAFGSSPGVNT